MIYLKKDVVNTILRLIDIDMSHMHIHSNMKLPTY